VIDLSKKGPAALFRVLTPQNIDIDKDADNQHDDSTTMVPVAPLENPESDWELVGSKWVRKQPMTDEQIALATKLFEEATHRKNSYTHHRNRKGSETSTSLNHDVLHPNNVHAIDML
jgi:hypothetical protein